jgi:hypothetical protein
MVAKFKSEKEYLEWMRDNASKAGQASTGYEFAHGKIDPNKASAMAVEARAKRRKQLL